MKTYFYKLLVLFGFSFWVLETGAFGWNDTAQSIVEKIADSAAWIMILWGVVGDITTNMTIHKTLNNNIKTKNVNINGKPILTIGKKTG